MTPISSPITQPKIKNAPKGSRTPVSRMRTWRPGPLDDGGENSRQEPNQLMIGSRIARHSISPNRPSPNSPFPNSGFPPSSYSSSSSPHFHIARIHHCLDFSTPSSANHLNPKPFSAVESPDVGLSFIHNILDSRQHIQENNRRTRIGSLNRWTALHGFTTKSKRS